MLSLLPGVLVRAYVPPRPAIKSAFLDVGDVIGHQIVAECVTFVDRAPEFSGLRIDGQASAVIANTVGVDVEYAIFRTTAQDVGALLLGRIRIGVVNIRQGTDGDEHLA